MNINIICSETYSYITLNDINVIKEPKNLINLNNIKHSLLFLLQSIVFLFAMLFNNLKEFGQTKWSIMTNKWILLILHSIFIIFVFLINFSFVCNFNFKKIRSCIINTILIFMFHFLIFFLCFIYFHTKYSVFTFFVYQDLYEMHGQQRQDGNQLFIYPNKILNKLKTDFKLYCKNYKNKKYIICYQNARKEECISLTLMLMIGLYFAFTIVCLCIYGNYFLIKNPYIILSIFIITLILFILTLENFPEMNDTSV